MIATEPGTNGIMDNRLVRDIAQYRSERKASEQQAFWAHRRPNYGRDRAAGCVQPYRCALRLVGVPARSSTAPWTDPPPAASPRRWKKP